MFKSPLAQGICVGVSFNCCWVIPIGVSHLTGTGFPGFVGCMLVMLCIAAAIAEFCARRKGG